MRSNSGCRLPVNSGGASFSSACLRCGLFVGSAAFRSIRLITRSIAAILRSTRRSNQRTPPNAMTSAVSITTLDQPKIWLPIYVFLPCSTPAAAVGALLLRGSRLGNYKGTMDHHRRLLAQLLIALGQRRCSTAIPEFSSTWRALLQTINRSFASTAGADRHRQARLSSRRRPAAPLGLRATRVAQQPSRQVVGEARVGTVLPGSRSGAHDPDRRPDLGDDRRARHIAADALSRVGDPQWPAEVADCTGEPSAAVERQQPGR